MSLKPGTMVVASKPAESAKFIATLATGKSPETAEQMVWDAVCEAFVSRDCIVCWRYPIFFSSCDFRQEPDILTVDFELGLIIIEIKASASDQILATSGHRWVGFSTLLYYW